MKTVWEQLLLSLEPEIEILTKIATDGAQILAKSVIRSDGIDVTIVDESEITLGFDPDLLTAVVIWVDTQLATWPTCEKVSWDTWKFSTTESYEKFMVLYSLKYGNQ